MCPPPSLKGQPSQPSQGQLPSSCPNSVPQQAASLPPLFQTSWASQTIPITLRLFKQTAAQFPSPDPQLRGSLWAALITSTPTTSTLPPPLPTITLPATSREEWPHQRQWDYELAVGSFLCLNVCRHLVKCLRPRFQRTTPLHHRACLSRQSQIRRGLPSFQKPRMQHRGWWCARSHKFPSRSHL